MNGGMRTRVEVDEYLLSAGADLDMAKMENQLGSRKREFSKEAIKERALILRGALRMAYYAGYVQAGDDVQVIVAKSVQNALAYVG